MARRGLLAPLVVVLGSVLVAAGCAYGSEEPGLLGRPPSEPASDPGPSRSLRPGPSVSWPTPSARPQAGPPVAGEAVWTSADGRAVTVRIAVHAVRRASAGTVLDWSITPLSAPGLSSAALPAGVDLGLMSAGRPAITLQDSDRGAVYRPLRLRDGRCVCSPVDPGTGGWRIGETRLLQLAFPPLAEGLDRIDVGIATIPVVPGVPVTGLWRVPRTTSPVDLTRSAELPAPYLAGPGFDYPDADGQRLSVQPYRLVAGESVTSLVWRVQAVTGGPGLAEASTPPLVATRSRISGNRSVASGPVLVAGNRRLVARLATDRGTGPSAVSCLCSDLRSGTEGMSSASQIATLVTTYDPLPADAREVLVDFPGYGQRRVDVDRARDPSADAAGSVRVSVGSTWSSASGQTPTWTLPDWPTPLPDPGLLDRATATVDTIVR